MKCKFIREGKKYTLEGFKKIFEASDEEIIRIINQLKKYEILKITNKNEAAEEKSEYLYDEMEDTELIALESNKMYSLKFVGVIIIRNNLLKCYPKYLKPSKGEDENKYEPLKELKQVLRVMERYDSKKQTLSMSSGDDSETFNLLGVIFFLLYDYYENGIYTNSYEIIESNGNGDILWERTINETMAILKNNTPYYTEIKTRKRINEDSGFFSRLHKCILTKCSKELKDIGMLELLDLQELELTDENLCELGDEDYILYRVSREKNIQFNTRKLKLLKMFELYISHSNSLNDIEVVNLYGTNSFNLVWEDVCAEVMGNQLNKLLGDLNLPEQLSSCYNSGDTLMSVIEHPVWNIKEENDDYIPITAKETLKPDLITIINNEHNKEFVIFDAKYYTMGINVDKKRLTGYPGIGDVTKQYLYQQAYRDFIKVHGFSQVKNCFLMPSVGDKVINSGYVSLKMLKNLGLEDIQIRLLPASKMYEHYLNGTRLDISLLNL